MGKPQSEPGWISALSEGLSAAPAVYESQNRVAKIVPAHLASRRLCLQARSQRQPTEVALSHIHSSISIVTSSSRKTAFSLSSSLQPLSWLLPLGPMFPLLWAFQSFLISPHQRSILLVSLRSMSLYMKRCVQPSAICRFCICRLNQPCKGKHFLKIASVLHM